jgi:hypothetical protein
MHDPLFQHDLFFPKTHIYRTTIQETIRCVYYMCTEIWLLRRCESLLRTTVVSCNSLPSFMQSTSQEMTKIHTMPLNSQIVQVKKIQSGLLKKQLLASCTICVDRRLGPLWYGFRQLWLLPAKICKKTSFTGAKTLSPLSSSHRVSWS